MQPMTTVAGTLGDRDPALDALVALHTRTVDSLMGFDKMLEKAEPEFRPVVQEFRDLHADHAAGLGAILSARGHQVDGDGSMMGMINQAVVTVRSLFDDIDADVMTNIRNGEKNVLRAFDDALIQPLQSGEMQDVGMMRDELVALLGDAPRPI